jgi:plastocyanin
MKTSNWVIAVIAIVIVVGVLFLIFTGMNKNPGTTSTGDTKSVTIKNLSFEPVTRTVSVGTKVTWTNNDSMDHTVTSDDGIFNLGTLGPGQSGSYTFTSSGTYPYHCTIHTSMKGTIIVK